MTRYAGCGFGNIELHWAIDEHCCWFLFLIHLACWIAHISRIVLKKLFVFNNMPIHF